MVATTSVRLRSSKCAPRFAPVGHRDAYDPFVVAKQNLNSRLIRANLRRSLHS